MQPVVESTWTSQWRAILHGQRDITHLLGADGRAENRSGRAMYVYPVFSVQVTCGDVFCTDNVSLIRLSYAAGRVVDCSDETPFVHSVFCIPWTRGITFMHICVP